MAEGGPSIILLGSNLQVRDSRLKNPAPIMKRIGAMMTARAKQTFQNQGRAQVRWPARSVPNVIGIIKDAEMGRKTVPNRRFDARPAGIDTRLLARSIAHRLEGKDTVVIGSVQPYATDVQKGGPRTIRITAMTRKVLFAYVNRARERIKKGAANDRDRAMAQIAWVLYRSELNMNVPPRPYLFFSHMDRMDIGEMVRAYIAKPDKPPGTGQRPS